MEKRQDTSFEKPELDLREVVQALREHKWLIVGVTLVVVAAGTAWTLSTPKVYETACTLEYDPNPSRPLGGQVDDVADPLGAYWATQEFFGTQNRVIASRDVASRAVRALALQEDPTYLAQDDDASGPTGNVEAAALALQSRLTVEPISGTRLVRIHARDVNPDRARLISNAVADAYVQKTIEDRLEATDRAKDWLENQLVTLRAELDEAELSLHNFKKGHNVLSVSMEDRQNLVASDLATTHEQLTATRNRRIELEARLKRLRASLGGPSSIDPAIMTEDAALGELVTELRQKKKERGALAVKYGANHPTMVSLSQEIGALEAQLKEEKAAIIASARHDVDQVRAIEHGLRSATGDARSAGLNLNLREIEYNRLNRERDNKAKLYEIVLQRLTETDLTRLLETTHVRVLDRALLPASPVNPNLIKNVGASLLAGLVLGLAAAFFVSRLDRTVRSAESVEGLGVTVLGVIPHLGMATGARVNAGSAPKHVEASTAREELIVVDEPMSPAAETFRMIRTNLAFMSQDAPLRSFVVTSALALEGKTTIASNLAISLAQFGRSVLLVDSDLRRPRLHRVLEVANDRGLSTLVEGRTTLGAALHETKIEGLSVLTSGPIPRNPSELLHSSAFGRLKEDLLKHFDYVLFDSPPIGAVTDASILAPQLDGALLVVRAGTSTLHAVAGAKKQLASVSGRLIGAVLNDADRRLTAYETYSYRSAKGYAPIRTGADAA